MKRKSKLIYFAGEDETGKLTIGRGVLTNIKGIKVVLAGDHYIKKEFYTTSKKTEFDYWMQFNLVKLMNTYGGAKYYHE